MVKPRFILQQARAAAGFDSPAEAARAYPRKINQNTLTSHENGNRAIGKKMAQVYAEVFNIGDPGVLLIESGQKPIPDPIPLVSMVSAGHLMDHPTVEKHDIIKLLHFDDLPPGNWIALKVDGDSMDRIAPPGSIVLVNRDDTKLIDGRFYIFALENGAATFKMFKKNPDRLQPYSTNLDHLSIPAEQDGLHVFGRVKRVINDV